MPRSKTGKTRQPVDRQALKAAVEATVKENLHIRDAAKIFNVTKSTLARHLRAHKTKGKDTFEYSGTNAVKQVFSKDEEIALKDYLILASKHHYGLTRKDAMVLAFQYAEKNGKVMPPQWLEKKTAGKGWLKWFMKRHPSITLRTPEATSLARSSSFNRTNVSLFFNNLRACMEKYKFGPGEIYNIDETGNSSVHNPPKVIAQKGVKQLGSMTSGERGINVTMIAAINGIGNHVPPLLVFPRVHFKEHMLVGAPPGTVGAANLSGWSNESIFLQYMEHFIRYVKPSVENPVLIVLDNHESHISLPVIDLAKENGIVLLTFPPHTSHKLQPLDRTVFGPYKTFYNQCLNNWHLQNPGTPVTLYQMANVIGKAYEKAFVSKNIIKGFEVTGICPFNEDIFGENEFLGAFVTDRYFDQNNDANTSQNAAPNAVSTADPGTSTECGFVSPEVIRPFPKAGARKTNGRGRQKGRTRILTWTPEKQQIEEMLTKRNKNKKTSVQKVTKKILQESSDEDGDNDIDMELKDSSSDDESVQDSEDEELEYEDILKGDFLLIKILGKKRVKHYVAEVLNCYSKSEFQVLYYKKYGDGKKFSKSEKEIYDISVEDIIRKLPAPKCEGGSERQILLISFKLDFASYNLG